MPLCKCKVVWNFQSIEFDYECNTPEDEEAMFYHFDRLLKGLQEIAPEQEKVTTNQFKPKKKEPKIEKATTSQVNCLKKLGIEEDYARDLSKEEAGDFIRELIASANNR